MNVERAYAKINLALHVRRRRDDGYHDLETIFAFCSDGDVVTARSADTLSLTIDGPFADGLSTTDNLVLRAARRLDPERGAALHLLKNLPVASGIGGGSADAAATLRLLSRFWNIDADLHQIAQETGSDVPACLASQTARGDARGDRLTGFDEAVTGTPVLLINPRVPLATAAVFVGWDGVDRGPLADWRTGRNDLEPAARQLVPAIGDLLEWLAAQNEVTLARMSGSGATCFALFESPSARDAAADRAQSVFPACWVMATVLR